MLIPGINNNIWDYLLNLGETKSNGIHKNNRVVFFFTIEEEYIVKILKIDDELDNSEDNIIKIEESSNKKIGTGSRVWECGIILFKYLIK